MARKKRKRPSCPMNIGKIKAPKTLRGKRR